MSWISRCCGTIEESAIRNEPKKQKKKKKKTAKNDGGTDVVSERTSTTPLVNRDSATRRARRLAVQFDVGELSHRS